MGDIIAGVVMGGLLLIVKMGSFYLFTGAKNQWNMPFTGKGARDWWYGGPVRKGIIDTGFGYIGAHIIPTNSVAGLFALGSYMIVCMALIFRGIIWDWAKCKARDTKDKMVRIIPI